MTTNGRQQWKTLDFDALRLVTERTNRRMIRDPKTGKLMEAIERVPFRLWYVAANGDVIRGDECVTVAVYIQPRKGTSRLVQFTASGQMRRIRDICIMRIDDKRIVKH